MSLETQEYRIRQYASVRGLTDAQVKIYSEALSGKNRRRPKLAQALSDVCQLKCPIVVYSLSRLSRGTKDLLQISDELKFAGADLVSLTEAVDTTTPMGRFFFHLMGLLNQLEREQTAERTHAIFAVRKERGLKTGGTPVYGYRHEGERLVRDDYEQNCIETIMELYEDGMSIEHIRKELRYLGWKPRKRVWHWKLVRDIIAREEQHRVESS